MGLRTGYVHAFFIRYSLPHNYYKILDGFTFADEPLSARRDCGLFHGLVGSRRVKKNRCGGVEDANESTKFDARATRKRIIKQIEVKAFRFCQPQPLDQIPGHHDFTARRSE